MPRPTRRAVAKPPPSRTPNTRQALKEKTNTARAKGRRSEGDGLETDIQSVKKGVRQPARQVTRDAQREAHIGKSRASGKQLLPTATAHDVGAVQIARQSQRREKKVVVASTAKEISLGEDVGSASGRRTRLANKPRQCAAGTQEASNKVDSVPSDESIDDTRSPELDMERAIFSLSPPPSEPRHGGFLSRPGSAMKPHDASAAMENSILALRNFKRRPRQPSMLQMVQQRRASAQPSVLGNTAGLDHDDINDDLTDDLDDDEFSPEAEGTPLHMRTAQHIPTETGPSLAGAPFPSSADRMRKRKCDQTDPPLSTASQSAKKRKRTTTLHANDDTSTSSLSEGPSDPCSPHQDPELQVLNSSPLYALHKSPSLPHETDADEGRDIVISTAMSEGPEQEPLQAEQLDDEDESELPGEILADPERSSPMRASSELRDIMADPLTQVSPPRQRAKRAPKMKHMSTSTLQSLLPKRRQPIRSRNYTIDHDREQSENGLESDEEIAAGDEDEDEDEITAPARQRRRPMSTSKKNSRTSDGQARSTRQSKSKPNRRTPARQTKTTTNSARQPQSARTYERGATSDKENEGGRGGAEAEEEDFVPPPDEDSLLPDVSISMEVAAQTSELADAKRKFAAVDDWEMEFESVSMDGERHSSSQMWR